MFKWKERPLILVPLFYLFYMEQERGTSGFGMAWKSDARVGESREQKMSVDSS